MKKWLCFISFAALISQQHLYGMASSHQNQKLTVLAVPPNYTLLQISFDLISKYPILLLSYENDPDTGKPFIHRWDGKKWNFVKFRFFESGRFTRLHPKRILIVGDEEPATGQIIKAAQSWCPEVMNLASIAPDDFLNTLGDLFSFSEFDWKIYAKRYSMSVEDMNRDRRKESWYDQPNPLKGSDKKKSNVKSYATKKNPDATIKLPPQKLKLKPLTAPSTAKSKQTPKSTPSSKSNLAPAPAIGPENMKAQNVKPKDSKKIEPLFVEDKKNTSTIKAPLK